jgi:glycosyltransferase involved in cell wall biosynthesis
MSIRRVVLIGNYLPDRQESMMLMEALLRGVIADAGLAVESLRPVERVGKLGRFFPKLKKWLGYVDKYLIFPVELVAHLRRVHEIPGVVYHIIDHSNAVYSLFLFGRPALCTCHDVLAIRSALGEIPENPTRWTGRILQTAILAGLKRTSRIICVSENSEKELRRVLGASQPETSSVLSPLNFNFHPLCREAALNRLSRLEAALTRVVEHPFVLHVGGNQWYKNRPGVCAIHSELCRLRGGAGLSNVPLLLAGKSPNEELRDFLAKNPGAEVHFLSDLCAEDLQALYSLAAVLLFPSLQEGFGWPILEAMACGCPVVTTGKAPMTEVGGAAASYIDPSKILESANALNRVLCWSPEQRRATIERGFENLRRFTRDAFAAHYLSAYREVLQKGTSNFELSN